MVAAFRSMDPSLEESALMSGATPAARPSAGSPCRWCARRSLAAMLIMLVRSLESFEVPALLGLQNGIYVFTSRIYFVLRTLPAATSPAPGRWRWASSLIAVLGVLVAQLLAGKGGKAYQTVTGKGFRPAADRPGQVAAGRRRRRSSSTSSLTVIGAAAASCSTRRCCPTTRRRRWTRSRR